MSQTRKNVSVCVTINTMCFTGADTARRSPTKEGQAHTHTHTPICASICTCSFVSINNTFLAKIKEYFYSGSEQNYFYHTSVSRLENFSFMLSSSVFEIRFALMADRFGGALVSAMVQIGVALAATGPPHHLPPSQPHTNTHSQQNNRSGKYSNSRHSRIAGSARISPIRRPSSQRCHEDVDCRCPWGPCRVCHRIQM